MSGVCHFAVDGEERKRGEAGTAVDGYRQMERDVV